MFLLFALVLAATARASPYVAFPPVSFFAQSDREARGLIPTEEKGLEFLLTIQRLGVWQLPDEPLGLHAKFLDPSVLTLHCALHREWRLGHELVHSSQLQHPNATRRLIVV